MLFSFFFRDDAPSHSNSLCRMLPTKTKASVSSFVGRIILVKSIPPWFLAPFFTFVLCPPSANVTSFLARRDNVLHRFVYSFFSARNFGWAFHGLAIPGDRIKRAEHVKGTTIVPTKMAVAGGFFVVLPSTTSAQAYPNNRPGSFRVDLPSPLKFGGPWKVALVDITFPAVFNAPAKPTDIVYTVKNLYFGQTELSPPPTTAQELLERVQDLFLRSGIKKAIRLKFKKQGDLTIKTNASSSLGLNFHLAHLLRLVTAAGTPLLRYYKHLWLGDFVVIKPRKTVTLWDVKAETPRPTGKDP